MNILHHRPLAAICLCYIAGLAIAACVPGFLIWLLFGILSSAVILYLIFKKNRRVFLCLCALSCCISLLVAAFCFGQYFERTPPITEGSEIVCTVTEIDRVTDYSVSFYADMNECDGQKASTKLYIEAYGTTTVNIGDYISCTADGVLPTTVYDNASYMKARSVTTILETEHIECTGTSPSPLLTIRAIAAHWRNILSTHLTESVPGESGKLMSAMLLGEDDLVSGEIKEGFRRTGIYHILSISGLHMNLLCGLALFICRHVGAGKKATCLSQVTLVVLYLFLSAFPLSAVRAGIMVCVVALTNLGKREADSLTALSLAAGLICLFSPYAVFDIGFWLSVLATGGIVLYIDLQTPKKEAPTTRAKQAGHRILHVLLIGLAANFATLPLLSLFFGEISLLSPIANLLFAPFLEVFLIFALIALPLGWLSPLSYLFSLYGDAVLGLMLPFSRVSVATVATNYTAVHVILFITLGAVILCLCLPRSGVRALWAVGGCGLGLVAVLLITCNVLALGQHAVLYQGTRYTDHLVLYSGGDALLCDFSSGTTGAAGTGFALAESMHVTELEGYYISHYHTRHVQQFKRLLAYTVIRRVYLPVPQSEAEEALYHGIREQAEECGASVVLYRPYEPFMFEDMQLTAHAYTGTADEHGAAGLTVQYEEKTLTYLGRGYYEGDYGTSSTSAVSISDYLIFGMHGVKENDRIPYRKFASDLSLVLGENLEDRLPNGLQTALDEKQIPWHDAPDGTYISFDS